MNFQQPTFNDDNVVTISTLAQPLFRASLLFSSEYVPQYTRIRKNDVQ